MAADFQQVVAANYIRNLRDEIKKGQNGQLKNGLYPWGAPIGYLNTGGGKPKIPDPERAPFVRLAFELYASGQYSYRSLLAELEQRGLRNKSDKPLSLCGLETLLKNPFYCGIIYIKQTGKSFDGAHEPIISVALFQRVQDFRSDRSGKKVTRHNHTYRGLFRCGECDGAMIPELQKGHVYYRCKLKGCATKTIREELLEDAAYKCLEHVTFTPDDLTRATKRISRLIAGKRNAAINATADILLSKVRDRMEGLTDALIDRLIDMDTFNAKQSKLVLEEARILEEKKKTLTLQQKATNFCTMAELLISLAQTYVFGKSNEKRQLVEMATSNRKVSGKNVYLEPANWVVQVQNAIAVLCCAEAPDSYRTFDGFSEQILKAELPTKEELLDCTVAKVGPEPLGRSEIL